MEILESAIYRQGWKLHAVLWANFSAQGTETKPTRKNILDLFHGIKHIILEGTPLELKPVLHEPKGLMDGSAVCDAQDGAR